MKIFIERIIVRNRAPFESLDLTFKENEIAVLTAVNGQGKTTILSYIVDSWYEMARRHFSNEFEGKENKYYRISSTLYNLNQAEPSVVYIRFQTNEGCIDYMDVRNECTTAV
jgi:predicted ATP-binding protein involved in virulence